MTTGALPRFDPLAPRPQERAFRRVMVVSIAIHLLLLFVFWNEIFGVVLAKDDTLTVRMLEEEEPPPERKVIAQTQIDTRVQQFKELEQLEIQEIRPELRPDTQQVDVAQLENIDAPKFVEHQDIRVQHQSVFADRPVRAPVLQPRKAAAPRAISAPTPRVITSSGPRKTTAASPRIDPKAVAAQPARRHEGVVSNRTVAGAESGDIAALKSGASDSFLRGTGEKGALGGNKNLDCMADPECRAYLKMIRDRVYARWTIPPEVDPGKVVLAFRIDRGGAAHGIVLRHTDDVTLGSTCQIAFRHASPFPPPSESIRYIVGKTLKAKFDYGS